MGEDEQRRKEKRTDAEQAEELVLAAARRAALHRAKRSAPLREIRAHLGIAVRSAAARALAEQLARLEVAGMLARGRERGITVWELTAVAERRLARAREERREPRLGESPQHAAWRRARLIARIEIGRLGADLRDTLQRCESMLARLEGPPGRMVCSDEWFALAERLRRDCRRVGSAQHCLREWQEPDEARPDLEELAGPGDEQLGERLAAVRAARAGRRNTRLWDERP